MSEANRAIDASKMDGVWAKYLPTSTAFAARRFPLVRGCCPACGLSSLFLGSGGYVTCSYIPCPDPTAVSDSLAGGAEEGTG